MLTEMSLALLLASAEPEKPPVDWDRSVESAVREEAAVSPEPAPAPAEPEPARARFLEGTLYSDITVTDWYNEFLILPSFRLEPPLLKGFGVPRGGDGGSPGFDPITREYWWE